MVVYAPDSTYRIVAEIPWKLKFTDKIYIDAISPEACRFIKEPLAMLDYTTET
jgi:hypothetical protein